MADHSDEPLDWGVGLLDNMGQYEIQHRLDVLGRQSRELRRLSNELYNERQRLLSAACRHQDHKKWARAQFEREEAFDEYFNRPSVMQSICPPRRVGWVDEEKKE